GARTPSFKGAAVLVLGAMLGLAGCAGSLASPGVAPPDPTAGYARRVQSAHVALFWTCRVPGPGRLQLDGVALNAWQMQPVRFLEIELAGVDDRERVRSSGHGAAEVLLLGTNQTTPFRLEVATTGAEVRFDMYYRYRFQDSGRDFIADAGDRPPILLAQEQRFLVRDACRETAPGS
ncbi:MAG: hypothetical protein ACE147_08455, partial [Candidatus Methylomirabilales bacterium]